MGTRAAIVCSPGPSTRSVGTSIIIRIICELAQRIRALADKLLEMKVRTTFVERIDSAEPPSPYRPTTARSSLEVRPATARCLAKAATLAREIEDVDDIDKRIVSVPNRGRFLSLRREFRSISMVGTTRQFEGEAAVWRALNGR